MGASSTNREHDARPAWRRRTEAEPRWPAALTIALAIALQLMLPDKLALGPKWVLPVLSTVLLVGLLVANPGRIDHQRRGLRATALGVVALVSLANAVSAILLVNRILNGTIGDASALLAGGVAIYCTNIVVFSLWYWEFDRGGPGSRALGAREHADFLFPQMANPEFAPHDWEPSYLDYLYLSFTNATAFSPTDVMPMRRWAKLTMLVQSAVSLVLVALVVARAVNILH